MQSQRSHPANRILESRPKISGETFQEAKKFFELPMETKTEVFMGLVPNEFVGYHPMEHYNCGGRRKKGVYSAHWAHLSTLLSGLTNSRSL